MIFLAAALAAATPAKAPEPTIEMTDFAWGQLVAKWRIEPNGVITYTKGATMPQVPKKKAHIETRRTTPSPARYRWIARLLAPARKWAGRKLPCTPTMTDQDSGSIAWNGRGFDYYNGCSEQSARVVVARLWQAQRQIAHWAEDSPVIATREKKLMP